MVEMRTFLMLQQAYEKEEEEKERKREEGEAKNGTKNTTPRDARSSSSLRCHPNIIRYLCAWQENGFFFTQAELCARGNLMDFLEDVLVCSPVATMVQNKPSDVVLQAIAGGERGGGGTRRMASVQGRLAALHAALNGCGMIPLATLCSFAGGIAAGLAHIHRCGVVHLDLKPANIFLTERGEVKIGDLGLVCRQGSDEDGQEGDNRYMAPELLGLSARKESSCDIYSFGLLLYRIATSLIIPQAGPLWRSLRHHTHIPLGEENSWTGPKDGNESTTTNENNNINNNNNNNNNKTNKNSTSGNRNLGTGKRTLPPFSADLCATS